MVEEELNVLVLPSCALQGYPFQQPPFQVIPVNLNIKLNNVSSSFYVNLAIAQNFTVELLF